jgi:hypothetical protein
VLVTALLCLLAGALLLAPTASAARVHFFAKSIGEAGAAAGQMRLRATAEPESEVRVAGSGVAINALSHLIYVADTENHRVDEFEADGTFVRAWGWGVGGGIGFETCTSLCQAGASGSGPGEFEAPALIAIDNSGGPSEGDVYVGDTASGVITKFTSTGVLESAWGTTGQLNGSTTGAGSFGALAGIAVDDAGNLDVISAAASGGQSHLFTFAQNGSFGSEVIVPRGTFPGGLGLGESGVFFKVNGNQTVEKFVESGGDVGQVKKRAQEGTIGEIVTAALAADASSGDLYVDAGGELERYAFNGSGEVIETGGSACRVEPDVGCEPTESFGASNLTAGGGAGVAVDSSDSTVYAADAAAGHVDVFPIEPLASPLIANEQFSGVTDDSAILEAEVNPRSLAGEEVTTYHFEYGRCSGELSTCKASGYPSSTTAESLPARYEFDSVSVPVPGLHPGAIYHFRVVATNAHGPAQSAERTFTTKGAGEFQLPDGRQWEMVSPAAMHGALILPLGDGGVAQGSTTQAASGGGGLAFAANAPTEVRPPGYPSVVEVLSTRGAAGWSSQDISAPHAVVTGLGQGLPEVRLFSEDLSLTAMQPLGSFVPLSEAASEQTAYLRDNQTGTYTPLVTGCPAASEPCTPTAIEEHADVPPGTIFGQTTSFGGLPCPPATEDCGPEFVGGTPDLKHAILTAHAALKPGANAEALYEWSAGRPASQQLQLVSLLPLNEKGEELPAEGAHLGISHGGSPNQRGALSADGSHVFFTAGHLYMRDTMAGKSIQIDAPEPGCAECEHGAVEPNFQFASRDGDRVFFTDTQKLTASASEYALKEPGDLYVCELHEDVCSLKDLAPAGAVFTEAMGTSEDGSWVYFVANGALAPGAVNGSCQVESPNASCDLYAEHLESGSWETPRLVAVLSGEDRHDWTGFLEDLVARVSPDGGWLAFMSQRPLTGYDNRDAVSGQPDQEVFLYEAAHGRLTCASCDPSGARPHGVEWGVSGKNVPLLGNVSWEPDTWLGGSIPGWEKYKATGEALYQPRYLTDSGRLFFDSYDALVPKDVNGTGDVYEYQPEGMPAGPHACGPASSSGGSAFRPARAFEVEGKPGEEAAGCVGLMSSGSSSEESAFLDASEGGGDVFFISTARLSPLDVEGGLTAYDAHECTASPCIATPAASPPACSTEASCKPAPSPQPSIFGPSGSATFSGPGNLAPQPPRHKTSAEVRAEKLKKALRACHKFKKRARRHRCERAADRRYGARVSARRAGYGRGAER